MKIIWFLITLGCVVVLGNYAIIAYEHEKWWFCALFVVLSAMQTFNALAIFPKALWLIGCFWRCLKGKV